MFTMSHSSVTYHKHIVKQYNLISIKKKTPNSSMRVFKNIKDIQRILLFRDLTLNGSK